MPETEDDKQPAPRPPEAVQDLTLDAALEHLMLDAQIVAHAQRHGRAAFQESEQRAELRAIAKDVGEVFARDGRGLLSMLGLDLEMMDDAIRFSRSGSDLVIRPGVDGLIEVGDHGLRPEDPFFTDDLYREIQGLVIAWALAVVGDQKALWSRKDETSRRG
jgi:hypothetical protein